MGSQDPKHEKSAVAKLRERFFLKKAERKPSEALKEALKKKAPKAEQSADENEEKVARPHIRKPDLDL
jgi:hypothetical protein